jgi:hypothetical protein
VAFARKAHQVVKGEDQRPVDQPVDHQPVVGLGQLDRAGMMPLEGAALRGDRALQRVDGVKLIELIGSAVSHSTLRRTTSASNRIGRP